MNKTIGVLNQLFFDNRIFKNLKVVLPVKQGDNCCDHSSSKYK
jgi:hypothetical protein